jgi:hypothetical protein
MIDPVRLRAATEADVMAPLASSNIPELSDAAAKKLHEFWHFLMLDRSIDDRTGQ